MTSFVNIFHEKGGLEVGLSPYINWSDLLALCCVLPKVFTHPYIRMAQKHYRIQDGVTLSCNTALKMLNVTRDDLGTELVETALLENNRLLQEYPILTHKDLPSIIHLAYPKHLKKYEKLDREVVRAIELSGCALYKKLPNASNETNRNNIVILDDLHHTSTYDYDQHLSFGNIIYKDAQASEIAYKTSISDTYAYIFMRRIVEKRSKLAALYRLFQDAT